MIPFHTKETLMNKKINHITTLRSALRLLAAGSAALLSASLLAGCGGGGSNGNSGGGTTTTGTSSTGTSTTGTNTGAGNTAQIAGKVTDTNGRGIPGVSIAVDTGGQITNTISTGGYRLTNLSGEVVHRITASATLNGAAYSGSTEVVTSSGNLVSNANILLSQTSQQATVEGYVRDTSGKALVGASVYLAVPNVAIAGTSGNYSSLAAFTDSTGFYQIRNVPAALPTGSLLMTAATPTTANANATISQNSITLGSHFTQNFTLTASANTTADTPVLGAAMAFTQPLDGLTTSALKARLASGPLSSGTVYETLRRTLSPPYATLSSRRRTLGSRLASRAVAGSYAVETDLLFSPPAATDTSLLGYYVYRTIGTPAANPVTEVPTPYDALVDPLANYYADITSSTDTITAPYKSDTTYNFAISAIYPVTTASGPTGETGLSGTVSITPLPVLTLNAPAAGATVLSPVTISWNPVAGAARYYVFVYAQYPGINTATQFTSGALPATTNSVAFTQGGTGTYYVVVVAGADQTETAGATAPVTNAVQSYSEITEFTVQ